MGSNLNTRQLIMKNKECINSNCSTGHCSTGSWSAGNWSTGNYSTGNYSTGHCSTGHCSTGNHSTGHYSTGDYSTGNWSTGNWSISNYSSGHFSTKDFTGFGCFDKPCTLQEWEDVELPSWLFFRLTEWVDHREMTEDEKHENPSWEVTGGFLRVYDYKEAFRRSYSKASREEQLKIKNLPNFNAEKFYQISGIRIDEEPVEEMTMEEVCTALGKTIKIKK